MLKRLTMLSAGLFLMTGVALAQSSVTGTVVDENGDPVVGAAVRVDGTKTGTVTDVDGHFSISAPANSKLTVSYLGMKDQTVKAGQNIKVTMADDQHNLDEVMVVAYGTTKKASFTGSAANISDADFSDDKTSLVKSLSGKLAGVRVGASTGDPGAGQNISIRGIGSVNGNTQPLYVVDGVPVTDGYDEQNEMSNVRSVSVLTTLDPNDIESMTVLKDAAASSLYGSRAANGVIIITTKKGNSGKTRVSYDGSVGWTGLAVPSAMKTMTAQELKDYTTLGLQGYYEYYYDLDATAAANAALNGYDGDVKVSDFFNNYDSNTSTDWYNQVYRHGLTTDHQVSMTGGNDRTQFYASLGYNRVNGVVKGSNFDRYSGRVNIDHQIYSWLKAGVKQMVSFTKTEGFRDQGNQEQGFGTTAPMSILFSMDPTSPIKNEDGSYNENAGFPGSKISNPNLMLGQKTGSYAETVNTNITRSMSNISLEAKLPYNFKALEIFGYDYTDTKAREFWSSSSVNGQSVNGLGERWNFTSATTTSSTQLSYSNKWDKHNFDAMAAYEVERKSLLMQWLSAQNYATDKLPELSNGVANTLGSVNNVATMNSWLGRANYNYDDKYYLSASFRRDGSSRLAKDNRWAGFWSVSGAWRLSSESFMKDNPLFSDFKIRASYGTNGNLPTDYYGYMGTYSTSGGYGSSPAIRWYQRANSDLTWEKSYNFNVGFDWTLYNRVTLSVEYYNKNTKDLLFEVPTSYVTGFGSKWENIGKLRNYGIETTITSHNIKTSKFSWDTDFNLTWQKSKVVELPDHSDVQYGDGNMYLLREGESMHTFYVPIWAGVNSETGLGEFWIDPDDHSKGVTNYYSQAGKGIAGKAVPDVIGGMTNRFTYGPFDLSFMISYQWGADMFDYPGYFLTYSDGVRLGNFNMSSYVAGKYWTKAGDNAEFPRPIYGNPYRSDKFSSREIRSTDNVRVRDITFGYRVPISKRYIQNMRLYFRATNPFLIYCASKDVDPDVDVDGYRQTDTPTLRSFVFGVNLTF